MGDPHFNSNNPCWLCNASRVRGYPHQLFDFSRLASWKHTLVTIAMDIATKVTDHPIRDLLNFCRFLSTGDLMHSGPLGTVSQFIGSVMAELVFDGPWEGTTQQRLQLLWENIVYEYEQTNAASRLSMLPLSSFYHGDRDFACLTGKAGDALSLLFVLHNICIEFNDGSSTDGHRLACLESLCFIFPLP